MELMHQIFIGSTYEDLIEERSKVIEAIMRMEKHPICMEYFNASSQKSWDFVQEKLKKSDCYLLILAGKYGTIDEKTKLGFTHKEFNYAKKNNIPILPFLHKNIEELPKSKTETEANKIKLLKKFVEEVKGMKECNFWSDKNELALEITTSLSEHFKNPSPNVIEYIELYNLKNKGENDFNHNFSDGAVDKLLEVIDKASKYNIHFLIDDCATLLLNMKRNWNGVPLMIRKNHKQKYLSILNNNNINFNGKEEIIDMIYSATEREQDIGEFTEY